MKTNKKGFTLVEIIISLAILSIVTTFLVTTINWIMTLQKDTREMRVAISNAAKAQNNAADLGLTYEYEMQFNNFAVSFKNSGSAGDYDYVVKDNIKATSYKASGDVIIRYFKKA